VTGIITQQYARDFFGSQCVSPAQRFSFLMVKLQV